MKKSFLVAAIHALIVTVVWLNYAWEQRTLPRAWARTAPVDPYDLLRGRYVRLGLLARTSEPQQYGTGQLFVENGELHIRKADCCMPYFNPQRSNEGVVQLSGQASFFIPQDIPDPSILKPGEELWAEVIVPPRGYPRPLRLEVRKAPASAPPPPPGTPGTPPQN